MNDKVVGSGMMLDNYLTMWIFLERRPVVGGLPGALSDAGKGEGHNDAPSGVPRTSRPFLYIKPRSRLLASSAFSAI